MAFRKFTVILTALLLLTACTKSDKPEIKTNSPLPEEIYTAETQLDSCDSREDVTEIADNSNNDYLPLNYDTQKAVWISYIDLAKWLDDSESTFRENITTAFENVAELGCNTVYVHVRAFADAYYVSEYYTVSKAVPTEDGTLRYDPLKIMMEIAHENGLSFHAWLNPLRCDTAENMERMSGTVIYEWYKNSDSYDEYVIRPEGSDYYWLNPAKSEVRELIANGAEELAEKYEIDGVHIDDYFYPTTDESFDENSYAEANTQLSLADWRLENCSEMVGEIYRAVKSVDERILFGVSPQGNMDNNYSQMYADVKRWCTEDGFLDYIAPQIYFGYENTVCPFSETVQEWAQVAEGGSAKLVCGLGLYKIDSETEFKNRSGIIAAQIEDVLTDKNYSGFAIYSYSGLFGNEGERFIEEREAIAAVLNV